MKKVYTLAAAMMISGLACANAADLSLVRGLKAQEVSTEKALDSKIEVSAKKATDATRADGEWKSLGEGTLREFMFSCWFKKGWDEDFAVEIEQNVADPRNYRVVNMYQNYGMISVLGDEFITYEATTPNYVYINTFEVNGETKWYLLPGGDTGVYITPAFVDFVGGLSSGMITLEYVISDLASASEEQLLSYYEKHPTCFGTLKDGVFTAPAKPTDLFYQNGDPVEWLMGAHFSDQQAGYIYFVNTKAQFTMTLPGVEIPEAPDPFDSYTFVGDCKMQQNFLDNLFSETGTPEGTVQVYEEPEYPGVFHIKNAYVAGDWNNAETAANIDLSIDLYDPSYGMIDEQSTGYFDDQYGSIVEIMSASMVYTAYIADQMTKQQFLMTYPNMNLYLDRATKRIVMPALSVWYYFPELAPGQEYYNQMIYNDGNASWIQLPESYIVGGAGVNEILTDQVDAPARYYNLQGVEVANPAKGELVIVKKGSKSSKVIF